jgi:hypothetical protein
MSTKLLLGVLSAGAICLSATAAHARPVFAVGVGLVPPMPLVVVPAGPRFAPRPLFVAAPVWGYPYRWGYARHGIRAARRW